MYDEFDPRVMNMAKTIGKYEIIRSLGAGAMGEVYLAKQAAIGREVAIKTILPSAAKGEDAESRFRREAEAAGKLSHPNIVTVFDFDKDGDVLYLVMEFVRGDDLEDLIKNQALSHSQFLEVLAQVCDGLSHAHRNGIIHRDIKPANVRVIRDGKNLLAKVMDFGIARMEDSNMTATGIVMGTVSYMAPEYIRGGHATTQSDLFAVGVMLYECLTGRKPFAGDNTTTILFKIVSETAPPIDMEAIHGISPSIRAVLDKALSKDPGARFQTADDFAKALRACKDPSWSGTLDEATSLINRHQQALAQAATQPPPGDGTVLIQPSAAPTALHRAIPEDGTTLLAPPPPPVPRPAPLQAPRVPEPAPRPAKGGRAGLYAAVGAVVLAAAGGGAYLAMRPKAPVPPALPGDAAAAPSQSGAPAQVQPAAPVPAAPGPQAAAQPQAPVPQPAAQVQPAAAKGAAPKQEPKAPANPPPPGPKALPVSAPNAPTAGGEPPKANVTPQSVAAMVATDPKQAAALAKNLVAADPGSAEAQGIYLAALYRSRNSWDFERALSRAMASSVTVKKMLAASPAFRTAMAEESRLRKANPPAGILSDEAMDKILAGL